MAYTVDRSYLNGPKYLGRPLVAWEELSEHYPPGQVQLIGPLSVSRLNRFRRDRYLEGKRLGYSFASFVHPSVECLEVQMGENCFVLASALLEPFVRLGNNVVVWSNAHIGHHTIIADHCFIGPGAGVGARCTIGELTMFGPKADILSGMTIGRRCFLGPRCKLNHDAPDGAVYLEREPTPRARFSSEKYAKYI